MVLSMVKNFYMTAGLGVFIVALFLIWVVGFIKLLLGGQKSRLQKEYGTDSDIREQKKRKTKIIRLVLGGMLIVCLVVFYIFVI